MKVGDLVCYNAGGMKLKTLGLVVDRYEPSDEVLVQWALVGEYMPRKSWGVPGKGPSPWEVILTAGTLCWHQAGDWFEVVK